MQEAVRQTFIPVILVDDEREILFSYQTLLARSGIKDIVTFEDSRQLLPSLDGKRSAVVVLDLIMPHLSGKELLGKLVEDHPSVSVIIVTGRQEIDLAVECMKLGAFDYLVKPLEHTRFLASVQRALELSLLREEVSTLSSSLMSGRLQHGSAFSSMITGDERMKSIFRYVEAIAGTQKPVLITGETGVGKELVARALHDVSGRTGKFVAVTVAGLEDSLFSDTLFGHRKGAFTGADAGRDGLVLQAAEGTLFLDEIGDLSDASQVKLLRLLQEGKYFPIGSDVAKQSNARIIAATNADLHEGIQEGRFRKDLFYRLSGHQIHVPPLRDRAADISLLAGHFLGEASESLKKKRPVMPAELYSLLSSYRFPGNVRELQSMIYDAVAQHESGILKLGYFRKVLGINVEPGSGKKAALTEEEGLFPGSDGKLPTLKEAEEYLISRALKRSGGNQGMAAEILGITRQALNKRLCRKKGRV